MLNEIHNTGGFLSPLFKHLLGNILNWTNLIRNVFVELENALSPPKLPMKPFTKYGFTSAF
jgi:hypothetical protein